ncbi:hypothetical protein NQ317_010547 [Molorchus minor]|uniref:Uncharacterized protein n=1 Tax=Molorchus minor TaxID=1323400 RepID=A0ABQ9JDR2_9CUCU|nr:hypothetical protein NQ317_010547 [Molorchus minor]
MDFTIEEEHQIRVLLNYDIYSLCPDLGDVGTPKVYQKLIDVHEVFDIRQSVFNTVYSVRCLSCLRVKGSFEEAALIIFPSTPIKNTEDGMKRWLRRAKKRRVISLSGTHVLLVLGGSVPTRSKYMNPNVERVGPNPPYGWNRICDSVVKAKPDCRHGRSDSADGFRSFEIGVCDAH